MPSPSRGTAVTELREPLCAAVPRLIASEPIRARPTPATLASVASRQIEALALPLGLAAHASAATAITHALLGPIGSRGLYAGPTFASDVGDDHTPFELSVSYGATHELRVLAEPHVAACATPREALCASRDAAVALLEELERRGQCSLTRFRAVADLFLPAEPSGAFALWIGAIVGPTPRFKVYMNPEAQGSARAPALVEEALVRLGFDRAWPAIARTLLARGPAHDELKYFALDLDATPTARVKVYARHHDATASDAERAASSAREYVAGEATVFLTTLAARERFDRRPLATCLAYDALDPQRAATATTYLPVNAYASDDAVVCSRLESLLARAGLDAATYGEATRAYAERPLAAGIGAQSYVAWKRTAAGPCVTVYYAAEAFEPGAVAAAPAVSVPTDAATLDAWLRGRSIAQHPYWQRLARQAPSAERVALLLASAREALAHDLARRLATTVARIDDTDVRAPIAAILNEELGSGVGSRAHEHHFTQLAAAFPELDGARRAELLRPARKLRASLDALHAVQAPYVGVGAALLSEIFGAEVNAALVAELARHPHIDPAVRAWIAGHAAIECEHASEAAAVVHLVARAHLDDVIRGAMAFERAALRFFDALYAVSHGGGA